MQIEGLRSPYELVGGLVCFGRMLDKIRLHDAGRLPADYNRIVELARGEPDDLRVLETCYVAGRRPDADDLLIFNAFMTKRGWRDEQTEDIRQRKIKLGLGHRDDLQTCFDIHDADEGRK